MVEHSQVPFHQGFLHNSINFLGLFHFQHHNWYSSIQSTSKNFIHCVTKFCFLKSLCLQDDELFACLNSRAQFLWQTMSGQDPHQKLCINKFHFVEVLVLQKAFYKLRMEKNINLLMKICNCFFTLMEIFSLHLLLGYFEQQLKQETSKLSFSVFITLMFQSLLWALLRASLQFEIFFQLFVWTASFYMIVVKQLWFFHRWKEMLIVQEMKWTEDVLRLFPLLNCIFVVHIYFKIKK